MNRLEIYDTRTEYMPEYITRQDFNKEHIENSRKDSKKYRIYFKNFKTIPNKSEKVREMLSGLHVLYKLSFERYLILDDEERKPECDEMESLIGLTARCNLKLNGLEAK